MPGPWHIPHTRCWSIGGRESRNRLGTPQAMAYCSLKWLFCLFPSSRAFTSSLVPLSYRMKFHLLANQLMMPASWSICDMPSPVPWQKKGFFCSWIIFSALGEMRTAHGEASVSGCEAKRMGAVTRVIVAKNRRDRSCVVKECFLEERSLGEREACGGLQACRLFPEHQL